MQPIARPGRKRALVVFRGFSSSRWGVRHAGIHRAGALSRHVPCLYHIPSPGTRREQWSVCWHVLLQSSRACVRKGFASHGTPWVMTICIAWPVYTTRTGS